MSKIFPTQNNDRDRFCPVCQRAVEADRVVRSQSPAAVQGPWHQCQSGARRQCEGQEVTSAGRMGTFCRAGR